MSATSPPISSRRIPCSAFSMTRGTGSQWEVGPWAGISAHVTSPAHQDHLGRAREPCWRCLSAFSSPFAKSVLEPYIRTHGGSTVASCGEVRSLAWRCARARPGTSAGDGHLWCGLDTLIYNDVWGKLCELFPAPRVTFDDHDHLQYSG